VIAGGRGQHDGRAGLTGPGINRDDLHGHRTDVQIGHVTHFGDAEALAAQHGHRPVEHRRGAAPACTMTYAPSPMVAVMAERSYLAAVRESCGTVATAHAKRVPQACLLARKPEQAEAGGGD
jgi:hypothetical protein